MNIKPTMKLGRIGKTIRDKKKTTSETNSFAAAADVVVVVRGLGVIDCLGQGLIFYTSLWIKKNRLNNCNSVPYNLLWFRLSSVAVISACIAKGIQSLGMVSVKLDIIQTCEYYHVFFKSPLFTFNPSVKFVLISLYLKYAWFKFCNAFSLLAPLDWSFILALYWW